MMKNKSESQYFVICRKLLRSISWLLMLLLILLWILCLGLLNLNTGTVHIGDYYNVQVLNNVSEKLEEREKVGFQPVFRNRRLKVSGSCTNKDISISQSSISTPGIPEFIVQIVNTCMSGCSPSHIHVHCGWFASAKMVNPNVFRRLKYDDCLVNGGKPLKSSQIIRFTYSNTFLYPLSFKSANFC